MTKIRLTNRKTAGSPNSEFQSNSGAASYNNNNNGSLLYRPLSGQNSSTTNDDYIDSQVPFTLILFRDSFPAHNSKCKNSNISMSTSVSETPIPNPNQINLLSIISLLCWLFIVDFWVFGAVGSFGRKGKLDGNACNGV